MTSRTQSVLFFLVVLLVVAGPASRPLTAQCTPDWGMEMIPPLGIDGYIYSMASYTGGNGPVLFAAGGLLSIRDHALGNLASFDGVEWTAPGGGVEGYVYAMAQFDDGSGPALYISGSIYRAGTEVLPGVARWDGHQWESIGGPPGAVEVLAAHDEGTGSALYAGVFLGSVNGVQTWQVFKWNGSSWSVVGGRFNNRIASLQSFDSDQSSELFVAGAFTSYEGIAMNNFARWNGLQWVPVVGSVPHMPTIPYTRIEAMTAFDDGSGPALYAAGHFAWTGPVPIVGIARWNRSDWFAVGSGLEGYPYALTVFDDGTGSALYAAGQIKIPGNSVNTYFVRWNGSDWSPVGTNPAGVPSSLAAIDLGQGPRLCAGVSGNLLGVISFNGSAWPKLIPPTYGGVSTYPSNGFVYAQALFDDGSGEALHVGGYFSMAGDSPASGMARWNGSRFSALGTGLSGVAYALAVFDDGNGPGLFVGGYFQSAGGVPVANIARWDGHAWWPLAEGIDGEVYALAVFDDGSGQALYAGGFFEVAGRVKARNIARWNGTDWSAVGDGLDFGAYRLAAFGDPHGSFLYAGLWSRFAGDIPEPGIVRWNGTTWTPVGGGLTVPSEGGVTALQVIDDGAGPALYVGGYFNAAGGIQVRNIARWDGTLWSPVGNGLGEYGPMALAWFDDGSGPTLYAGGFFEAAGGCSASRLARFDGQYWHPVGSGLYADPYDDDYPNDYSYARVTSLLPFDDGNGPSLFVGGWFRAIEGHAFRNIARLIRSAPSSPIVIDASGYQLVCAGESVSLSITAIGHGPLTYRWRKNGIELSDGGGVWGVSTPMLQLHSLLANHGDAYDCRVSDSSCEVISAPIYVIVTSALPVITRQPANQSVKLGTTATFSVSLSDYNVASRQWRRNGIPLQESSNVHGTLGNTLTIVAATPQDAGNYDVVLTNPCGSVTSIPARLLVYSVAPAPPEATEVTPAKLN